MTRTWNSDNSITESELARAIRQKAVTEFHIIQSADGFYVTVRMIWRGDEEIYLATRRVLNEPRIFKDIGRLLANIQEFFPTMKLIHLRLL